MSEPNSKMLPCPFCGGDHITWVTGDDGAEVYCKQCRGAMWSGSLESAIELWNHRASPPAPATSELLPCPHCGSEPHTPTCWPSYDGPGVPIPRCTNPECLAEAKDAAAWNRRVAPPCPPEVERLVAAARRALPALAYAEHNAEEREAYCELSTALAPFERPAGQDHGQLIAMTKAWLAKGYPLEDLCE